MQMQMNFHSTHPPTPLLTFAPIAPLEAEPVSVHIMVADLLDDLHASYRQLFTNTVRRSVKVTFVGSSDEAARSYKSKQIDLVVFDLRLSGAGVFEAAARIWLHNAQAKIIFLVDSFKEWHIRKIEKIVPARAVFGYILKGQSCERIGYGVDCVFSHGNTFIDPLTNHSSLASGRVSLSDAEYATLVDMALGLTDRAIAARQNVSLRGIQNRITLIFKKLLDQDHLKAHDHDGSTVNMRVRVVVEAIRRGLIDIENFAGYERDLLAFVQSRF